VLEFSKIQLLQSFGIALSAIKSIVADKQDNIPLRNELNELEVEIHNKQAKLQFLKYASALFFNTDEIEKRFKPETVGPFKLLCLLIENGDYDQIDNYIQQLKDVAENLGILYEGEITFYHHYNYQPKRNRLEVALICKSTQANDELNKPFYFKVFPKTRTWTLIFTGPYTYLPLVYPKLDKIARKKSINVITPIFEQYLNDFDDTASTYRFRTKIVYPIQKIK
jgi:effector-binding domain-containing protein